MNLADYQRWLNAHGATLTVDGKGGPKTRSATFAAFTNKLAPAIAYPELDAFAMRLGCTASQLCAVALVESAGGGFQNDGMPKVLYERHYFWRRLQIKIPLISDPAPGGYTVDADHDGLNDSWEKIADAAMRSPEAAFESASFGKFQIMGAWAKKLGYANAIEFAYSMVQSERCHYEALVRYVETFGLKPALRQMTSNPETCRAFAKGYNGPGYAKFDYHRKLARAL
jgi:hypothetical protein